MTIPTEKPVAKKKTVRRSDHMMPTEEAIRCFANEIDTARQLWGRYPHLIGARDFPEPFLAAYLDQNDGQPGDIRLIGEQELVRKGVLKPRKPKAPLSIHEIRTLRQKEGGGDSATALGETFSVANAGDPELDFLTICQALYRRYAERPDVAAPFENFLWQLVFEASFGPVKMEDIQNTLEEFGYLWDHNRRIADAAHEDERHDAELKALRNPSHSAKTEATQHA